MYLPILLVMSKWFCFINNGLYLSSLWSDWHITYEKAYIGRVWRYQSSNHFVAVSFIGGGNRSTRRKTPTCRKSLTSLWSDWHITYEKAYIGRVWRYQSSNQHPYIEQEQTTQWPKETEKKEKQRSTNTTQKTRLSNTTLTNIQISGTTIIKKQVHCIYTCYKFTLL
jgi:hypothetical protein